MSNRRLHGESMLTEAGRAEWGSRNARASALAASPYKKDFPLLSNNPNLAFLDSAATAQRPKAVLDARRVRTRRVSSAFPTRAMLTISCFAGTRPKR